MRKEDKREQEERDTSLTQPFCSYCSSFLFLFPIFFAHWTTLFILFVHFSLFFCFASSTTQQSAPTNPPPAAKAAPLLHFSVPYDLHHISPIIFFRSLPSFYTHIYAVVRTYTAKFSPPHLLIRFVRLRFSFSFIAIAFIRFHSSFSYSLRHARIVPFLFFLSFSDVVHSLFASFSLPFRPVLFGTFSSSCRSASFNRSVVSRREPYIGYAVYTSIYTYLDIYRCAILCPSALLSFPPPLS